MSVIYEFSVVLKALLVIQCQHLC